jgi:hypothetical protein
MLTPYFLETTLTEIRGDKGVLYVDKIMVLNSLIFPHIRPVSDQTLENEICARQEFHFR